MRGASFATIGELGHRLNLAGIAKFEDERKNKKNSGSSSAPFADHLGEKDIHFREV